VCLPFLFFFSSRRRHTRFSRDWSSDVCSSDLADADRLSDPEGAELLRWFEGGMLTLLGHLTHARSGKQAQRLGICRKSARELVRSEERRVGKEGRCRW